MQFYTASFRSVLEERYGYELMAWGAGRVHAAGFDAQVVPTVSDFAMLWDVRLIPHDFLSHWSVPTDTSSETDATGRHERKLRSILGYLIPYQCVEVGHLSHWGQQGRICSGTGVVVPGGGVSRVLGRDGAGR